MLELVLLLTSIIAATGAVIVALRFDPARRRGTWRGGRRVTVTDLAARYEEALVGLVRISLVLPRVEDPAEDAALVQAVKRNLARGVRYAFLVSKDRFEMEKEGYYNVFRMYARDAVERSGTPYSEIANAVDRLVRIVPLTKNWSRHPYIFYHCVVGNDRYSFAFRGSERNQGIAKTYVTVSIEEAAVLYESVQHWIDPKYAHLVTDDLSATQGDDFEAAPARPARGAISLVQ